MGEISDRFFSNFVQIFSKTYWLQKWNKNVGHRAKCCTMRSQSWVIFAAEIRSFLMVTTLIRWHSAVSLISKTTKKVGSNLRENQAWNECPLMPVFNHPPTSKQSSNFRSVPKIASSVRGKSVRKTHINQIEFWIFLVALDISFSGINRKKGVTWPHVAQIDF